MLTFNIGKLFNIKMKRQKKIVLNKNNNFELNTKIILHKTVSIYCSLNNYDIFMTF